MFLALHVVAEAFSFASRENELDLLVGSLSLTRNKTVTGQGTYRCLPEIANLKGVP